MLLLALLAQDEGSTAIARARSSRAEPGTVPPLAAYARAAATIDATVCGRFIATGSSVRSHSRNRFVAFLYAAHRPAMSWDILVSKYSQRIN